MKAMMLKEVSEVRQGFRPLVPVGIPVPEPGIGELLIQVAACGVCHTELDEIEGRTPPPFFPVIPGHQVVGRIVATGKEANKFSIGSRVGVAWIVSACGKCEYCLNGNENLCPDFKATGRDVNGGYAEYMIAGENFVHPIPDVFRDEEAAPLLCAGAVGYRSLKFTNLKDGDLIGLTGFGASGHLVLKMIQYRYPRSGIYVFARNEAERAFAKNIGATWAGDTTDRPPELLNAIIDTTPVWKPVVEAMKYLKPGGRLVINAIRKENVDRDYLMKVEYPSHLWMEKEIKSVANVALSDVRDFLAMAALIPLFPEIQTYALEEANSALLELKQQKIKGAKVLMI